MTSPPSCSKPSVWPTSWISAVSKSIRPGAGVPDSTEHPHAAAVVEIWTG
jgi:hypothetical protein